MSGRKARPLTADGLEALDEVRLAEDLLREARRTQVGLAARRRSAVVRARAVGVTYRRLAAELGVTVPAVHHLVSREQARRAAQELAQEAPV